MLSVASAEDAPQRVIVYCPVLLCSACVPNHTLAEHVAVVLYSWDRSDGIVEFCSSAAKATPVSAGRPLLVSLLLYLDTKWPRQWDAETLFLDDDTDIGIVVRPKCFRAVLMDQVIGQLSACTSKGAMATALQWSSL